MDRIGVPNRSLRQSHRRHIVDRLEHLRLNAAALFDYNCIEIGQCCIEIGHCSAADFCTYSQPVVISIFELSGRVFASETRRTVDDMGSACLQARVSNGQYFTFLPVGVTPAFPIRE